MVLDMEEENVVVKKANVVMVNLTYFLGPFWPCPFQGVMWEELRVFSFSVFL